MAAKSFWCSRIVAGWLYAALFTLFIAIFHPVSAVVFAIGAVASLTAATVACRAERIKRRPDWWNR